MNQPETISSPHTSRLAVGSMLLGLAIILPPFSLAAVLTGFFARKNILASGGKMRGEGFAIAGMGLGAFGLLVVLPAFLVIGLPKFRSFQTQSREKEALMLLDRIKMGAQGHSFAEKAGFPQGDTGWAPSEKPSPTRYRINLDLWSKKPWTDLDFRPPGHHFYQYRYLSQTPDSFLAEARGDLDGDGVLELYRLQGQLKGNRVETVGPKRIYPAGQNTGE